MSPVWQFAMAVGFLLVGIAVGALLVLHSERKAAELPEAQRQTLDELAPEPHEELSPSQLKVPGRVPQFGLPESRVAYSTVHCANDRHEVPMGEHYVFVPLKNGVPGSGIALCLNHTATEVAPDGEGLDDPADV